MPKYFADVNVAVGTAGRRSELLLLCTTTPSRLKRQDWFRYAVFRNYSRADVFSCSDKHVTHQG